MVRLLRLARFSRPNVHEATQGPRSLRKCAGAKGGTIFLGDFLMHFCAICKNDPCSKSENVPGLKPRLPRRLRGPWTGLRPNAAEANEK